jgi:hypothetical protein
MNAPRHVTERAGNVQALSDEFCGFCRNKDDSSSRGNMISNAYLANE